MSDTIRWGILSPSNISNAVVPDIQSVDGAEVVAVASTDAGRAKEFAAKYGIPTSYGSYPELIGDPNVDVVYISSRNEKHHEHAKAALEAGKAVVLEKPFTINAREAKELIDLARSKNLFLMEALWSRIHPNAQKMAELIATGNIGHVRAISASLGPIGVPADFRGFEPEHGGGALLECGVYPIHFMNQMVSMLGEPAEVEAWSTFTDKGVDESTTMIFRYKEGVVASLSTSLIPGVDSGLPSRAYVSGSTGWIDVPKDIFNPDTFSITRAGQATETITLPPRGSGYAYEAEEVVRCLREGKTESPLMPLDNTLIVMRLMDRVREAVGLKYPSE